MPSARSFVAIVGRTLPSDIRSPKRSIANHEFHRTGHDLDEVARRIARELSRFVRSFIHLCSVLAGSYLVSRLRPFAIRRLSVLTPAFDAIRLKKPCSRLAARFLG
jgi:hypothetical protein